jgi:hypothetical protein
MQTDGGKDTRRDGERERERGKEALADVLGIYVTEIKREKIYISMRS